MPSWTCSWWDEGRGSHSSSGDLMPHPRQTQPSPQAHAPKRAALVLVLMGAVPADADSSRSPNSSMTTRELQEYWRNEKGCWKPVKLLFEIASARIEDRKFCKFVVSAASSPAPAPAPSQFCSASAPPAMDWVHTLELAEVLWGKR